jgi:arylformamidase
MDMDRAYANGDFIDGAADFPPRWNTKAKAFREALGADAQLDIPYGPDERNRLDIFLPKTKPIGLLVFVHGGYWLASSKDSWSHLAAGALAQGWACAMPSYTLAPQARLSQITAQIAQAVSHAARQVTGPVVVTGHSAGGHLAARMGCTDMPQDLAQRVCRVVPISPLADLTPLLETKMRDQLWLDEDEVVHESPALLALRPNCAAHVWVGANERPAFLWQARTLSEEWMCPWTPCLGKHHFDVIDDLANPASALMQACLKDA